MYLVLVIQVNSRRGVSSSPDPYNVKVISICNLKSKKRLEVGDKSLLIASERDIGGCKCPSFSKGAKYRVGVDVRGKLNGKWRLEMRQTFYAELSDVC